MPRSHICDFTEEKHSLNYITPELLKKTVTVLSACRDEKDRYLYFWGRVSAYGPSHITLSIMDEDNFITSMITSAKGLEHLRQLTKKLKPNQKRKHKASQVTANTVEKAYKLILQYRKDFPDSYYSMHLDFGNTISLTIMLGSTAFVVSYAEELDWVEKYIKDTCPSALSILNAKQLSDLFCQKGKVLENISTYFSW